MRFENKFTLIEAPYNAGLRVCSMVGLYLAVKYVAHNFTQTEFDIRDKGPNMFVPEVIYKTRRDHYVYWEISRLARGLPKTFTYSDWDAKAKMMYHVDMEGNMCYEKINLREERIDLLENPMLGPLLRRKEQLLEDDLMTKRANRVAVYYLNIHKRYDLDVSIHCYYLN